MQLFGDAMMVGIAFDGKLEVRIVVEAGESKRILFILPFRFVDRDIGGLAGDEMIAFGLLYAELFHVVGNLSDIGDFYDRFHRLQIIKNRTTRRWDNDG